MNTQSLKLGRLERVDLRTIWEKEDIDFTPWLARDENIALLGDTVGIDLEVEAQEKEVGPFRADILCKDTATSDWVLIENQLEKSDHKHLGQLMTYASGLHAVTIIWITEQFTDEHRSALDWLNEVTREDINFFGLEVELWKIGDSNVAPKFNVVSKPNDWSRSISGMIVAGELTETKKLQLLFWTEFRKVLDFRKSAIKGTKPLPQHWNDFAIGSSEFHIQAFVNTVAKRIGVTLVCRGDFAKANFDRLESQKTTTDAEFGEPLQWKRMPEKKQSHVTTTLSSQDISIEASWPVQHQWLADRLEKIHFVFAKRIKNLNAIPNDSSDPEVVTE